MPKRLTTNEFIDRSLIVHKGKYGYNLVEYVNSQTRVNITCDIHGVFEQKPGHHLRGVGCSYCARKKITTASFIEESKLKHGDRYDYSLVSYKGSSNRVKIKCLIHGFFEQQPTMHLSRRGCPECGIIKNTKNRTRTTEKFIRDAIAVHSNRYDYSETNYTYALKKLKIKCKVHGFFTQMAYSHLQGHGCSECKSDLHRDSPTGWSCNYWSTAAFKSKNFDSFKVYIIKCWNDNEEFYKIGRTYLKINKRFCSISYMPYNYELIKEFIFNTAKEAFDYENKLKREHKQEKYVPQISFNGKHECFKNLHL